MSESKFNKRMRDELTKQFGFVFFRVESHATSPGIADDHWLHSISGATGWLEMKQCVSTPKKVPYRPYQAPWLQSYARAGGRAGTIIHISQTDGLILVPGRESIVAAGSLQAALGTRTLNLGEPEAWKKVASWILAL